MENFALYAVATLVLGIVGIEIARGIRMKFIVTTALWGSFRLRHFAGAAGTVAFAFVCYAIVKDLHPAMGLSLGKMLLGETGGFNVGFAPAVLAEREIGGGAGKIVATAFVLVLAVIIAPVNQWEEETFRMGYDRIRDVPVRSAYFGAAHFLMGIPVSLCVVLSFVGAIWHVAYLAKIRKFRDYDPGLVEHIRLAGACESALYHNAHNNLMFVMFIAYLWA